MSTRKTLIDAQPFSRVLAAELVAVRKRRQWVRDPGLRAQLGSNGDTVAAVADAPGRDPALDEIKEQQTQRQTALEMHLTGLAVSGGGIRSATFALGILQGLAELDLLKRLDYISTVSGGGYIGGWLAAWTKREGSVANVHRQLRPRRDDESKADRPPLPQGPDGVVDEEPEPIHHLRSYSSYLAPRPGVFTTDTWSLMAIYARNLLINFLILVPATFFVVTLVRLALLFFRAPNERFVERLDISSLTLVLGMSFIFLIALSLVFNVIGMELFKMQEARNRKKSLPGAPAKVRWLATGALLAVIAAEAGAAVWNWGWVVDLLQRSWARPLLSALVVIFLFSATYFIMAQYKLRTQPKPAIGIYRLVWLVIVPLVVSAVLSCWLFSIDPESRLTPVVVERGIITRADQSGGVFPPDASNFVTRLRPLGYKVLVPPHNPPAFLAGESPTGRTIEEYDRNALAGWKAGRFYWWPALMVMGFFAFMHGVAHLFINWIVLFRLLADDGFVSKSPPYSIRRLGMFLTLAIAPFISGAVGGLLFFILVVKGLWSWHHQPHALVTFGPPLALLLFVVSAALEIGLLGRRLEEDEREWWARVGALALLAATAWVLCFTTILYVPWLIEFAGSELRQRWLKGSLTVGWLVTSIAGAIAGRSPSTGGGKGKISVPKELIAQVAPWVFLVGLLAGVSLVLGEIVDADVPQPNGEHDHWAEVGLASLSSLLGCCVGSGLFALLMASVVDVNLFSLHNMYANRLIRAYLGASRKKKAWKNRWSKGSRPIDRCGAPTMSWGEEREENPISGFDFDDDIPLREFRTGRVSLDLNLPAYWGPFPLINTALNLVATRELDWQERLAESFVLSPLFCGSESTGYQRLPDDFRRGNMTLGRAVAISGAAADPNMGHHTSTAVTALMTVFNTRLGWWIENPSRPRRRWETTESAQWAAESPSFGGLIVKELTGQTDSIGRWVHLSDGGHFENLAAYELIRRRCRYVVVSDAGCDPGLEFEDLANLIRKCRTDFGIRIEIDTAPIQKQAGGGPSRWHCAIGKIRYDDVDGDEVPGMLVYLKSSLTGDEPPDLQQYARRDPTFPHQSTADQFFDETQFECYRALGYHIAHSVFGESATAAPDDPERANLALFSQLRDHWFPAPPELEANFEKVSEAYEKLQQTMRSDHNLRAFTYDLYPELGPAPADADLKADPIDRACAELHAVNQVVLLMEKAWTAVKLEGYPTHPMNRGWMNQFRRCATSATVRRLWPVLRGAFSPEFVRFCEQELLFSARAPEPVAFSLAEPGQRRAYESLRDEFAREWPAWRTQLEASIEATQSAPSDDHRAWLILDGSLEPFAYGIALKTLVPRDDGQPVHEVMVWVRPAYRNLRIGQKCFQALFSQDGAATLRVRYPKSPSGGDKVRLELWKFFHYAHNFVSACETEEFLVYERRSTCEG
jgi:hypothetical protein